MAQTAIKDGGYVAKVIRNSLLKKPTSAYTPSPPIYAIPVGEGFAAVVWGRWKFYGKLGWWMRRLADLRFFLTILPFKKAMRAYDTGGVVSEACGRCSQGYSKVEG
jgi:NADH dehydrogenase FAD-containing subunit